MKDHIELITQLMLICHQQYDTILKIPEHIAYKILHWYYTHMKESLNIT